MCVTKIVMLKLLSVVKVESREIQCRNQEISLFLPSLKWVFVKLQESINFNLT